jgi:beta-glucosidase
LKKRKSIVMSKKIFVFIVSFVLSFHCFGQISNSEIELKVDSLLSKMTLQEKAAQLVNIGLPSILKGAYWAPKKSVMFDTTRMERLVGEFGLGCVHNTPSYPATPTVWYNIVKTIQDYAMHHTRMGIPVIYGIDNIHGANYVLGSTLFPQQIAIAATWEPKCAYRLAEITSYESRAASLVWNYNPNADVSIQPLWGRMAESFGEDPFLISQMITAYTDGSQHNGLQSSKSTAVCVKHFLGYGAGMNGKDRANSILPESYIRQYYLVPFKAAIDNGAQTIMLSSNSINGIPCHTNKYLITDVLKTEFGFNGVVVSDFSDLDFLVTAHSTASDIREATKQAFNAGLDMAMTPYDNGTIAILVDLVAKNEVPLSRINDAARRVLRLKYKLNLFEKPYVNPSEYPDFASKKFIDDNYAIACEAITLLKNDSILPLKANKKVLVTGYTANSINILNGAWTRSFQGRDTTYNDPSKLTILQAIRKLAGSNNVIYSKGTDYLTDINTAETVKLAKDADVILVCIGEMPATEKPSDINSLDMPAAQQQLVKELAATGKPVVLVLVEGRPRLISDIEPLAKGIVTAYLPGDEGGRAVADVLYGKVNPSGKLPYTYPKYSGNAIPYYHKRSDIRDITWGYNGFYPQYEFGFGLSYTKFEYSNLKLSADTISGDKTLTIEATIKNVGNNAGKEVVQCFIHDVVASVAPDVKRLVCFSKIELAPGEQKTVTFTLNKNDLAFVGQNNKLITESGKFELTVGNKPVTPLVKAFWWKE